MRASLILSGVLLLGVLLVVQGCASTQGAGTSVYTADVGTATFRAAEREAQRIFSSHGYGIYRRDVSDNQLHLETYWVERSPFEDEQQAGVVATRTRFTVVSRPRATANSSGERLHAMTLRAEHEVQRIEGGAWQQRALSQDARAYADEIAAQIRRELIAKGLN